MSYFNLKKFGSNFSSASVSIFYVKMTHFFSRWRSKKIESFWPKNLGQDFFLSVTQLFWSNFLAPPVFQFFRSRWLIFSLSAPIEKIKSFWPKNLGQILVPPVIQFFLGQNDSFFLSVTKQKNWVILTQKFGSNFSSANLVPNFCQI